MLEGLVLELIHTNKSTAAATVNFKSVRAYSFPQKLRFKPKA